MNTVAQNIRIIRQRMLQACLKAGRDPQEVKLLLATKTVSAERIKEAFACGEILIAENKVQELKEKYPALCGIPHCSHFIGHLQSNKVKDIVRCGVECVQSLDSLHLAEKLHQRLQEEGKTLEVLIQVNTSGENSKFGVAPERALELIYQVSKLDTLKVNGLMTIGALSEDEEKVRSCFRLLKQIGFQAASAVIANVRMREFSMGMSGDLEWAIEEGATIIRVGSAVFGKRSAPLPVDAAR